MLAGFCQDLAENSELYKTRIPHISLLVGSQNVLLTQMTCCLSRKGKNWALIQKIFSFCISVSVNRGLGWKPSLRAGIRLSEVWNNVNQIPGDGSYSNMPFWWKTLKLYLKIALKCICFELALPRPSSLNWFTKTAKQSIWVAVRR